jgi:cytochrome c oxidase subunit 2
MLSIFRRGSATGLVALAMMLATGNAMAAWDELNLPVGVTPISRDVYDLHMLVLWICVIIGIIVFGAMFVSIVLHRKAAGHEPAQFHHSTFAEIVWTVIPSVILLGLAIPATKTLIDMEDTSEAELTLKVTAYQWLWKYEYVEDGVSFYSSLAPSSRAAIYGDPWQVDNYLLEVDNPVVLPVGKKVRILLTADDVIHAWWMPALGVKKDAIPGFINEMWVIIEEPGTYRGQCAELCGKDHGFMPIVVEAKSDDEYKQWVAAYKAEQKTQLAATAISSQ